MKDCQEGDKNGSRDKKEATKEKSKKEKKEKKAKKEDPQTTKEKKESARSFPCENLFLQWKFSPFAPLATFFQASKLKIQSGQNKLP